jgi:hypothetical protein
LFGSLFQVAGFLFFFFVIGEAVLVGERVFDRVVVGFVDARRVVLLRGSLRGVLVRRRAAIGG